MSVQRNHNFYWTDMRVNGVRYQENTGIEVPPKGAKKKEKDAAILEAKQWEQRRKQELNLRVGKVSKATLDSLTFAQAAQGYLDGKTYRAANTKAMEEDAFNRLAKHLGPLSIKSFVRNPITNTVDSVKAYVDMRLEEANGDTRKNRTLNVDLMLIRKVLKVHNKWADIQPIFKSDFFQHENEDIGKALSLEDMSRLLEEAKKSLSRSLYPALLLAIHTGLRSEELRTLRWSSVLINGVSFLKVQKSKTKGGKGREVYLSQTAIDVLLDWKSNFPNAKPEHYVFPSEVYRGNLRKKENVTIITNPTKAVGPFKRAFETAQGKAGVKLRWHDLRHTAASLFAAARTPDYVMDAVMGWDMGSKMRARYSHATIEAKQLAANAMLAIK
jgi:integrase